MTSQLPLPNFDRPNAFASGNTLVVALQGWNDAGESASAAVSELQDQLDVDLLVERLEDEDYFDYTVARPRVELGGDGQRVIRWPGATIAGPVRGGRIYTLTGVEPNFRWRRYASEVIAACERVDISSIVLVGALLADAPHTRDILVYLSSDDEGPQRELDIEGSTYEGPTGVLSAIAEEAHRAGIEVVSMWASVPHYAQSPELPNPKASLSLVNELAKLLKVDISSDHLRDDASAWEERVTEAVESDDELRGYVEYLEQTRDVVDSEAATGEAIAAEFERFLADGNEPTARGGGKAQLGDLSSSAKDAPGRDDSRDDAADDGPNSDDEPDSNGEPDSSEDR
ncbi:proteasome assembly chaperone family protein [Gulosibacter faecalis]|uniref:Proteasome assembly chaperone family protein n=1 Tax=Gulosibacter faecalis TaxID=272240 RepID=A0ABW5UY88_9MICO|nr:PAC2 family protein [Gulosibacter faecalis]